MIVILFALGLIIGSFLGALTYRLPRNISIAKGRSFCPNCKHQIAAYDNIPVISWLILGGKCRNCKHKISFREPLIEISTAIIFIIIGFNVIALILACILISIFIIDFEHQLIPDELVFIGIAVLMPSLTNLLAGLLAANLLLFLNLITKGKGMGLGDVKLAILLGAIVGLSSLFNWLFMSFLVGAMVGIILMLAGIAKLKQKIAFGPFLIIGLVLTRFLKII
jgi:prepilin signal peptidase PulO-like enzyme (type II secretory pathway)